MGRDAIDDGVGPLNEPITAVPKPVRADGTMFVRVLPVAFVTVMVKVAVSSEKRQSGVTIIDAVNVQLAPVMTVIGGVVTDEDVRRPVESLEYAVNVSVPGVVPAVYIQTMVPVSPGLRVRSGGLEVVVASTPVRVGGLGTDVTPIIPAVERFVMVMVRVNWQPIPTLYVDGTRVISRDLSIQEPGLLIVKMPVLTMPSLKSWSFVKDARASRRVSVTSLSEVLSHRTRVKGKEEPDWMASAQEVAWKVIELAL